MRPASNRLGGAHRERPFGLSVGTVLIAIAVVLAWRGRATQAEVLGSAGGILVVCAWLRPSLLKRPSDAWWALAMVLGWVNARVLLSLAFFLVLTPIGLLWRLTGKDPLTRRRAAWPGWSPYPARYRDRRHFERMF
jgi:hypothetical protein